jgi:hypothetical protein
VSPPEPLPEYPCELAPPELEEDPEEADAAPPLDEEVER